MAGNSTRLEALQAARKLLQNPCAYVEDLEEEKANGGRSPLYRTCNPYATLADWDGSDDEPAPAPLSVPERRTVQVRAETLREFLSKTDFRSECNRIFLPYVPPRLPRRVSQQQRDFIARNEGRSGKVRYRLIQALRRYDLSTTSGIAPQFNREHAQELSEKKLREVEALVADD